MYSAKPDVQMNDPNNLRVFHNGRIYDVLCSPNGPWTVWTVAAEQLGDFGTCDDALAFIEQGAVRK